jgi:hypothetical protein
MGFPNPVQSSLNVLGQYLSANAWIFWASVKLPVQKEEGSFPWVKKGISIITIRLQ